MKIPIEKVPISLEGFVNNEPASIPLMLTDLHSNLFKNNQLNKEVMCGFGVGLSWGTAGCDLSNTKF